MSTINQTDTNVVLSSYSDLWSDKTSNTTSGLNETLSNVVKSKYGMTSQSKKDNTSEQLYLKNNYGLTSEMGQAALKKAASELSEQGYNKITFAKIVEYRQDLQDTFSAKVRVDTMDLGVDPTTDFTVALSSSGKVQVLCDDEKSKVVIEKYFQDNPEKCEEFGYIQALTNFEKTKVDSPSMLAQLLDQAKSELNTNLVSSFFEEDSTNPQITYMSMLTDFLGGDPTKKTVKFYSGIDTSV